MINSRLRDMIDDVMLQKRGISLEMYVQGQRKLGVSWSTLVFRVYEITGIKVSDESLRKWHNDDAFHV